MPRLAERILTGDFAEEGPHGVIESDLLVSHNLQGQRLGRKGRVTRERILAAAERLLVDPHGCPISLSAVAREASLGMTTLYLYFSDLTELLLAILEPIMDSAESSYIAQLRTRWPDDSLGAHALAFVSAFHGFWERHTRVLHLRNTYASGQDARMAAHRLAAARPLIDLLIFQMDVPPSGPDAPAWGLATALLTGIERLITMSTDADLPNIFEDLRPNLPTLLGGQGCLLELGIRHGRSQAWGAGGYMAKL